jgi:hypothetical protein
VGLTIPNSQVSADAPISINFSSTRLPAGTAVHIQQQVGTAHVWKTVASATGTSGSKTLAGKGMGVYEFRIVAVLHRRTLASSPPRAVYFYGPVTMTTLCTALNTPCSSGTEQIGTTVYEYAEGPNAPGFRYPEFGETFHDNHITCRSAVITFASDRPSSSNIAYLRLLQASSEPQEASTPGLTVGTFDISFDSGPWYLDNSNTDGSNDVVNGTFSCYTPTGL